MKYLTALLLFIPTVVHAHYLHLPLHSRAAIVVDARTNHILYEKHADTVRSIASITKLMTAVVTLDAELPLDEKIQITEEDMLAASFRRGKHWVVTSKSLPVGVRLTRAQLLHLALMNSQNRAAAALARTYPGGVKAFIQAMNNRAAELGMTHTHYVDPTGLYNANVSTAEDLAKLVKAASDYALIRDFSTSVSFETTAYYKRRMHKLEFGTTNRLVTRNNWDIKLQKTGYIHNAGHCMVMLATFNDKDVIIVLLHSAGTVSRALDAITIKKWIEKGRVPTRAEVWRANPYRHHYRKRRHK